jgi:hypothetical protein
MELEAPLLCLQDPATRSYCELDASSLPLFIDLQGVALKFQE